MDEVHQWTELHIVEVSNSTCWMGFDFWTKRGRISPNKKNLWNFVKIFLYINLFLMLSLFKH